MEKVKIESLEAGDRAYADLKLARAKKRKETTAPDLRPGRGLREDTLGAQLERGAVRHALKTHYGVLNPTDHLVDTYVQVAGALAHGQGGSLPGAKRYADHINAFNDSVVSKPAIEQAGSVLHGSGLLGLADRALTQHRAGHTPLPVAQKAQKPRVSGFVDLGELADHDAHPSEVAQAIDQTFPGKIKPAGDETIKPASLAPAAKKARRDESSEATGLANDPPITEDAPLPLADSLEETKGTRHKERHAHISANVLTQKPAALVAGLAEKFGISHRAAQDTLRRWIEARREGFQAAEARDGPHRFARKGQSDVATAEKKADLTAGVRPVLAGTRLAMHLIQIAKEHQPVTLSGAGDPNEDPRAVYHKNHPDTVRRPAAMSSAIAQFALHALHGTKPDKFNGDVFARLGQLLAASGHRYHNLYNWGLKADNGVRVPGIGRRLEELEFLHDFVNKNVTRKDGMSDRHYLARVLDQFARDKESIDARAAKGDRHQAQHEEFWRRLHKAYGARFGKWAATEGAFVRSGPNKDSGHVRDLKPADIERRLTDGLYRLHTLADDRETLAADNEAGWERRAALPFNTTTGTTKRAPGNAHMKFSRADLAALAILAHLNPRVRQALTNRGVKFDV